MRQRLVRKFLVNSRPTASRPVYLLPALALAVAVALLAASSQTVIGGPDGEAGPAKILGRPHWDRELREGSPAPAHRQRRTAVGRDSARSRRI